MRAWPRQIQWVLLLGLLPFGAGRVWSQPVPKTEYEWKVVALYNFTQFTTWPKEAFTDPNAPFVIGIYGRDSFGQLLELLKRRKVGERKIDVIKCNSLDEAAKCHVLFISASEKNNLPQILGALKKTSVLTVGETETFLNKGGIVNFWVEERATDKV